MPSFLDAVKPAGADFATSAFNTLIAAATGGFKGRPQWRDLQFMNDAQNRLWPDEINRQGQFLEGVAPSQAAAYNTYQDETYMRDVTRRTEGIKAMGDSLGMSPWELTGQGGAAAPLPSAGSAGAQQGNSSLPQFLQAIMPLQLAKMQNATQLRIAKMSNDTQRYGIDMAGGQSDMAKAQIRQIASNIKLQDIQHSNGVKDLDVKNQGMVVQTLDAILRAMPKDTLSLPFLTSTNTPGWQAVVKTLLKDNQQFPGDLGRLNQSLQTLPPDAWGHVKNVIIEAAGDTIELGADVAKGVGKYLNIGQE